MSEPLWKTDAMASAMNASRAGRLPAAVGGLSIDTRTLKPGEAFFAIKGDARDGHDFVPAALKAGAGIAVVAADRAASFGDASLLIVPDVLDGLRDLARASRARSRGTCRQRRHSSSACAQNTKPCFARWSTRCRSRRTATGASCG